MKALRQLLGLLLGGILGTLPGLLIGYLAWFPLREWLFGMIPPEVQWAFWAKLVTCVIILFTVGGSFSVWLTIIGGLAGLKIAAEIID